MKILIINQALGYGGAQKQALVDANSLVELGHEVTMAYYQEGEFIEQLNEKIKCLKLISNSSIISGLQILIYLLFHKSDVVHTHQYWASKVGGIPGKLTGNRVIYNEHGLGKWRRWYHRVIIWFLSLFADKVITSCKLNSYLRNKLDRISENKLMTLYNSFEIKHNGEEIRIPQKEKDTIWIGYVGRFNKVKQLEYIIKVAKRLKPIIKNVKFVLVGDGKERQNIEKIIKNNSLDAEFIITGFCKVPYYYYKTFDVFVLPSKIEGFSISLLEAGASGVPTVCFDVGGNKEIVQSQRTGFLIPPFNIDEMTSKILQLCSNKDLRLEYSKNAKEYITNNFSVEKRRKLLDKLYRDYNVKKVI
ncbi:MAG: glycosyltransferase family 4 protein [Candidatus Marinimicrobia bacterium]|nr:glycosyltransferase family 4 protein [Candidatus Neomarinimicrobiota bacterium]